MGPCVLKHRPAVSRDQEAWCRPISGTAKPERSRLRRCADPAPGLSLGLRRLSSARSQRTGPVLLNPQPTCRHRAHGSHPSDLKGLDTPSFFNTAGWRVDLTDANRHPSRGPPLEPSSTEKPTGSEEIREEEIQPQTRSRLPWDPPRSPAGTPPPDPGSGPGRRPHITLPVRGQGTRWEASRGQREKTGEGTAFEEHREQPLGPPPRCSRSRGLSAVPACLQASQELPRPGTLLPGEEPGDARAGHSGSLSSRAGL